MKFSTTVALLVLVVLLLVAHAASVGDPAPDFVADSTAGKITLSDLKGQKNVILAFYYKDFTGG